MARFQDRLRHILPIFRNESSKITAEFSRLRKKGGMGRCRAVPRRSCTGAEGYSWTGQRKSAEAFLVTVTVPALCAARTAAWEVRRTGVASWLNVTRKTFQWPP